MKKYKWDLKELRLNREKLYYAYEEMKDVEKKETLLSFIELYDDMINMATNKTMEPMSDLQTDSSIINLLHNAAEFYTIDNLSTLNVLIESFPVIAEYAPEYVNDNIRIAATNDEVVDICRDFFVKMTPKDILKKYDDAFKENNNFLNIMYSKDSSDYSGVTLFDYTLQKKYVAVSRSNKLLDLVILPHEMFHYLFSDCNVCFSLDHNSHYLAEVEGGFANILFSEYYMNNAKENNDFFRKYYLNSYQSQIEDLTIRNALFDSIKKNNGIRMHKLNKFMSYYNMLPFDNENEIIEYLEVPQDVNIKYAISFLAALDLYYIYKKDPDFAFYLLKNIRYHVTEDNIMSLLRRNHITFMDDDYTNLKKYLKK